MPSRLLLFFAAALIVFQTRAVGDEVRVAVASNFSAAMDALSGRFQESTDHQVVTVPGSSGKHYAQIRNGAPFDLLLSADAERPRQLEEDGVAVRGSRFTYAVGALVLWSPQEGLVDAGGEVLERLEFRHLAIANPRLAPYGRAAYQVLEARGLWTTLRSRLVQGESVAQAFQFVRSGNAELAFVALAQLRRAEVPQGSRWLVPPELYEPIEQQAVLLEERPATQAFARFLQSEEAREIIRGHGYTTP